MIYCSSFLISLIAKRQKNVITEDDTPYLLLNDDLLLLVFSFVDFPTLVRMHRVSTYWMMIASPAIPGRLGNRMFLTNLELRNKIRAYCWNDKVKFVDEIASNYGWTIGKWNVSKVTDFSLCFLHQKFFNEDIGDWNMSSATTLEGMLFLAKSFNQDLSRWGVSKMTNMTNMFCGAASFNGDVSTWNTSKVITMYNIFAGATMFNQNISSWNVSKVRNMWGMFRHAESFNQNISSWNVENVTDHGYLFCRNFGTTSFNNDYAPNCIEVDNEDDTGEE